MSLIRRAFVAGGGCSSFIGKFHPDFIWKKHPDFGTKENPTYSDYIKMVVDDLIKTTGVNPEDVDRLYLGNFVGHPFWAPFGPRFEIPFAVPFGFLVGPK